MKRTHTCGELTAKDIDKEVTLAGWADTRRDHGGLIFIDLRDRYGITQIVFDPEHNKETHSKAEKIGREYVVQVVGKVRRRPANMENKKIVTGEVEVICSHLDVLNPSEIPPFEIDDRSEISEELRLKYRYLDLRRNSMQANLQVRHTAAMAAREYLSSQKFLEIETPMLGKTTPGGARVFKVPSRVHPGKFYALPESPQLYKQLLMVSGCDRYFQLAKCMRDEDQRADRQLEFTQIDMEMSFVDQEDVWAAVEGTMKHIFKKTLNIDIETPFRRMPFQIAMEKYGSDKPDLRFGLEFTDVSEIARKTDFSVFKSVLDKKGKVICLPVPKGASFTRKDIDELTETAKIHKLAGLAWAKISVNKEFESSIAKYIPALAQAEIIAKTMSQPGDLLLFAASNFETAATALGQVRLQVAQKQNLIPKDKWVFSWIVDFPLFEWSEEEEKWNARHHIFTMPRDEDMDLLEKSPDKVRGKLYDLVLNGTELVSGSIRIHNKDIQTRVLNVIGMTYEEAEKTFDFLLTAFKYGAPPHGGAAIGFDRLVALMCGTNDIREVIAFPKTKAAESLMDGAPQEWTNDRWLKELHLKLDLIKK